MRLSLDALSDVGCVREHNEDIILASRELLRDEAFSATFEVNFNDRFCAIVADGMGGHNGGELASEMAAQRFDEFLIGLDSDLDFIALKDRIDSWAQNTHKLILQRGCELEGFNGMGTTLVGFFQYEGKIYWINIGDSRLYLFRDGILRQISKDHSLRNLYHDMSQPKNAIFNSLGAGDSTFADFNELPVFEGDHLLVCSDGMSDMCEDEQIQSILASGGSANKLVEAAKANGGEDNISVILVGIKINDNEND